MQRIDIIILSAKLTARCCQKFYATGEYNETSETRIFEFCQLSLSLPVSTINGPWFRIGYFNRNKMEISCKLIMHKHGIKFWSAS